MRRRSERLTRLVAVQRHLERLAERDLALAERDRARAAEALDDVVAAMSSLEPVHRNLTDHYARRVGGLAARLRQAEGLAEVRERRLLGERAKAERLGEKARRAADEDGRAADEEALYELLDRLNGAARSSLP